MFLDRTEAVEFVIEQNGVLLEGSSVSRERLADNNYYEDIQYTFQEPGLYDVLFRVTSSVNCSNLLRRAIEIFPVIEIPEDGSYSIDFEDDTHGWRVDTLDVEVRPPNPGVPAEQGKPHVIITNSRLTSWQLGGVEEGNNYMGQLPEGSKAWFTKVSEERSDGTSVTRPWL